GAAPDAHGWMPTQLRAGRVDFDVRASERGYRPLRLAAEIDDGVAPFELELALERGVRATFDLAPAQLTASRDFSVYLVEAEFTDAVRSRRANEPAVHARFPCEAIASRTLFADGMAQTAVRGLAPGRYRLTAFRKDVRFEPDEIVVASSDVGPIVVSWS